MDNKKMENLKNARYKVGIIVFVLLAVLTAVEFGIAWFGKNLVFVLIAIALCKAFFVIRDYMHVGRLFTDKEE